MLSEKELPLCTPNDIRYYNWTNKSQKQRQDYNLLNAVDNACEILIIEQGDQSK